MENPEKKIKVCQMIQEGMVQDVSELEGKPFTGKNVADMFWKQAAAIAALARIVEQILGDQDAD